MFFVVCDRGDPTKPYHTHLRNFRFRVFLIRDILHPEFPLVHSKHTVGTYPQIGIHR